MCLHWASSVSAGEWSNFARCVGISAEDLDESSESSPSLHSEAGQELRDCSIIISDEVSQSSRLQLGLVDKLLRVLTGKLQCTMGGKVVVFVGDFRQTTLVPPMFGGRIVHSGEKRAAQSSVGPC